MIAIIDYDAGNIRSVEKAFNFLGQETVVTRDRDILLSADKVILPGVGSFGDAMDKLNKMIKTFDHESTKIHKDYHLHAEVEDSDLTPFDAINGNSKVVLHFVMLIYNALKKSKGNAVILEKYLKKLKGEGEDLFSIEEINSL